MLEIIPSLQIRLFEQLNPIRGVRLAPLGDDRDGVAFVTHSGPIPPFEPDYGVRYAYGHIVDNPENGAQKIVNLEIVENETTHRWALASSGSNSHLVSWVEARPGDDAADASQVLHFANWTDAGFDRQQVTEVFGGDEILPPAFGGLSSDGNRYNLIWSTDTGETLPIFTSPPVNSASDVTQWTSTGCLELPGGVRGS